LELYKPTYKWRLCL